MSDFSSFESANAVPALSPESTTTSLTMLDKGKGKAREISQASGSYRSTEADLEEDHLSRMQDTHETVQQRRPASYSVRSEASPCDTTFAFPNSDRRRSSFASSLLFTPSLRQGSILSAEHTALPFAASAGDVTRSPINIPASSAAARGIRDDLYFSRSPGSISSIGGYADEYRRPSHTRARSSLGSSNVFDFFGPSSLASDGTAATSFHFGSPKNSPKMQGKARADSISPDTEAQVTDRSHRKEQAGDEQSMPSLESRTSQQPTRGSESSQLESTRQTELASSESEPPTQGETGQRHALSQPPVYPEEILPSYEEAPEYTPPLAQYEGSTSRSRTSAFRAAAANRFLSSRIGRKLNLPPGLRSRLEGTQTPAPGPVNNAQGYDQTPRSNRVSRIPFNRSDSAPELFSQQRNAQRRVEMRVYVATNYMNGAVMGPSRARPQPIASSSRPSTPDVSRARASVPMQRRPATSSGIASGERGSGTAPTNRSQPPTAASSRRNSRESRPGSRATYNSGTNGGLFTCGYGSNRSGANTPSRSSMRTKPRSRNISLRNLGDLILHRDRDKNRDRDADSALNVAHAESAHFETSTTSSPRPDPASAAENVFRETVTPMTGETLISARVHAPIVEGHRPSLLRPAHSSPQAGISSFPAPISVLVSPHTAPQPNYFERLPRELILECFKGLVQLHVHQFQSEVKNGTWSGRKTSDTRWVGVEAALRELVRISRVSRAWQSYTLDGQLWRSMDMSCFPDIAEEAMLKIARSAGPFIQKLDLHGLPNLRSSVLVALFDAQRPKTSSHLQLDLASGMRSVHFNQLQELSLAGCRRVSTPALHKVLSNSPNLRKVDLSTLPSVNNTTLCILAQTAECLEVLKISRCPNVNGQGLRTFFAIQEHPSQSAAVLKERKVDSVFSELHAAGISGIDSTTMEQIGRHWPNLQVLDLTYCSEVNNAAVAALVSSNGDVVSEKGLFVTLSPRQAGSSGDDEVSRRLFPRLKKLKLSSCRAITDKACMELAYSVPNLEVLEIANIGGALKDAGLVKLLATVPHLKRLDLERATQITDAVLSALTPPESHAEAYGLAVPDEAALVSGERSRGSILTRSRRSVSRRRNFNRVAPNDDATPSYDEDAVAALIPATGTELTHLILSSANQLSASALLLLINRCPFLYHVELDDTRAGNTVATQFVYLARYRKVQNAYLSLVDCRSFSRDIHSHLAHLDGSEGGIRPRRGQRGYAYRHFGYDDVEPSTPAVAAFVSTSSSGVTRHLNAEDVGQSSHERLSAPSSAARVDARPAAVDKGNDECNASKPVLKSFWGWQSVDARFKQKRKMEQRANKRSHKSKVGNVVAMALGLPVSDSASNSGNGRAQYGGSVAGTSRAAANGDIAAGSLRSSNRWSRIIASATEDQDGYDSDEDDARGCRIM